MNEDIRSLENQLAALNVDPQVDPSQTIDVMTDLAWQLRHSDSQRSLALSQSAYELAQSQDYAQGRLRGLRNLAALSTYIFPEHDRALTLTGQALALLEVCPDAVIHAHLLECLATIQINLSDYPAAHVYLVQALKLCHEAGDRQTESMLLNDLGVLYYRAGDFQRGLESFQQALKIAQTDDDLDMQARMLNNIGDALNKFERHEEAFPYLEQALALSQHLGTRKVLADVLDSLSAVYVARHQYEQALACLQRACELATDFNDSRMQAEYLRNMARVYRRQNEVDPALDYAHRALVCAEAARNKSEMFVCHQLLAELYEMQYEPEQALSHYKQFHTIKEEVFNAQSDQELKTLRVIHETETARQEAEIYRLKNIELQVVLDKVKQLSGLLPICASCKKIRDDDGYWHDVAAYIRDHSEADFTHSICPSCYEKLYPESYKKRTTGQLTRPPDKPDSTGP
jgi:tetratricopeptide (TPR) repeat protein